MNPLLSKRLFAALLLALPAALLLALMVGQQWLYPEMVLRALLAQSDSINDVIVRDIRLPRALFAMLVGAILASCGAAMQGMFRNPLADPSLIGVTGGASMGASVAIVLGLGVISSNYWWGFVIISVGAFIGGSLCTLMVYRLAVSERGTSVAMMLLAGIAVTAFAGAVSTLCEFFADNEHLRRISLWQMGSLEGAHSVQIFILLALVGFLLFFLQRHAENLNALLLGESEARHLGVNVDSLKLKLILMVALAVGLAVAMAGTISFVGLIVPHLVRLIIGPNHRHLLLASAMAGALLLLLADTLARTLISPSELPVGVVTALAGAPFFIALLRYRKQWLGE